MIIKIFGAICIVAACGGMGCSMAATHRREEAELRRLIGVLNYMGCELQYRLTPLPELCQKAATQTKGAVGQVMQELTQALNAQISPDASCCMQSVVSKSKKLPEGLRKNLLMLGTSLGRFDLQGQLNGLDGVRVQCCSDLDALEQNRDFRLRSYLTLSLCAGFALAILFL